MSNHNVTDFKMNKQTKEKDRKHVSTRAEDFSLATTSKSKYGAIEILLSVIDNVTQAVFITDLSGCIKWINPSATRISGYDEKELLGANMSILKSDHQDQHFYEKLWDEINDSGYWEGEIWNRRKDRVVYLQWLSIYAIKDDLGETKAFLALCTDLSEKENFLAALNRSSFYDNLTGLPNQAQLRKSISDVTDSLVSKDSKHYFVALNIDRFSYINMSYGYSFGDKLLIEIGKRISGKLRDKDNVFRLSSDLFVLIFRDVPSVDTLINIVNRISDLICMPYSIDGKQVSITASYGISLYPDDGQDYDELMQNAEIALRVAKESGKNTFKFFSQTMNEKATKWIKLGNELQDAILKNDMRVYYQIQVENGTGIIKGAEALVRWKHEKYGILSPCDFIPYAEISGLIIPLGYWIIENIFMLIKDFKDRDLPTIKYSINLSSKQIVEKNLVDEILKLTNLYDIDPAQVEFEITESSAMENTERTFSVFRTLKDHGFTLAIDDFGTGYSSLSYLADFPVDVLKIDRSFISNIDKKDNQRRITTAILSMAETIGLKTVAEGVETIEEVEFLNEKTCDLLQGYYFSKPVDKESFEQLLLEKR
ncbi:MAG: EAL domain-containing protein [Erysipelothrix sp.]|jgi:diguanylate cyclase (GGDEF)-like protein/PAS domain S-box-containing protein|nr:EAL domain-containing protein [Erysipelothrix sp.]